MADNDLDLLKLAAKAAGIIVEADGRFAYPHGLWNPITDDGDALRLAVCLHLDINQFPVTNGYVGMIEIWCNGDGDPAHVEYVRSEDDRLAATRRAIVRAAAEIGGKL